MPFHTPAERAKNKAKKKAGPKKKGKGGASNFGGKKANPFKKGGGRKKK